MKFQYYNLMENNAGVILKRCYCNCDLVAYEESQREKMISYDTYSFIPFAKIDGVRYFNMEQVDKWVEYSTTNRNSMHWSVKYEKSIFWHYCVLANNFNYGMLI